MAWTLNKIFDQGALQQVAFWKNRDTGEGALNVEGQMQVLNSDGEVIDPATGAAASTGGGSSTYSTSQGDFTAVPTVGANTITLSALPFTLKAEHVVNGSIRKISSTGEVTILDTNPVSVSGNVITLSDEDNFVSGDTVTVSITGPDKAYDVALDAVRSFVINQPYDHYTSVEHIINESDLGLDGVHDGAANAAVFTDTSETYTAETVAEGYEIYNVTDGSNGTITADTLSGLAGDGGAGNPTADDITATLSGGTDDDWDVADVASIPECKRFVIPAESYNLMAIDVLMDSQDANNSCYCKIYATLDPNADDTDDIYWTDISQDVFGASQLSADGIGDAARAVHKGIYFIDTPTVVLKYMIKIVAENNDGTQDNEFDIRIKKSSNG